MTAESPAPSAPTAGAASPHDTALLRGDDLLRRVEGRAGEEVLALLTEISPAMAGEIRSWAFGRIYARPQLSPLRRQLVTLGALTALGDAERQLCVHVEASGKVGLTRDEIVEVFLHCVPYVGFARAMNALLAVREFLPVPDH